MSSPGQSALSLGSLRTREVAGRIERDLCLQMSQAAC